MCRVYVIRENEVKKELLILVYVCVGMRVLGIGFSICIQI